MVSIHILCMHSLCVPHIIKHSHNQLFEEKTLQDLTLFLRPILLLDFEHVVLSVDLQLIDDREQLLLVYFLLHVFERFHYVVMRFLLGKNCSLP